MELVDTHCHIQSAGLARAGSTGERITRELWAKDPNLTADAIIENAAGAGVNRLICVGTDFDDSQLAVDFVQDRPNTWAAIGIHPHEAAKTLAHGRLLPPFAALAKRPKVVAIGECGLDYFYNHSPKADQLTVIKFQLNLAAETGLPLILHVREALDDFWPLFDDFAPGQLKGVLHSFTDTQAHLEEALKRGLYIGVNGIATFAKKPEQLAVFKAIPLNRLLLETDSPFLTPHPFRGKINEPKQIGRIAEFMAELRGESLTDLAAATTQNARDLFGI